MTMELSLLWKSTLILAAGLMVARLARRASASVRHLILALAFGALIALPVVEAIVPAWTLEVAAGTDQAGAPDRLKEPIARGQGGAAATGPTTTTASGPLIWPAWLPVTGLLWSLWALGSVALLSTLATSLWKVRSLRHHGIPWIDGEAVASGLARDAGLLRPVHVLLHEGVSAPITLGHARPVIVVPNDAMSWSESDLRRAFVHELEHVRRGDWSVQIAARVACALYWFHPLTWVAWRHLCLEGERACDDAVLNGAEHTDYAHQLVTLAQRLSLSERRLVLSMADRSDLSVRVRAVLDSTQLRGRAGRVTVIGSIAIATVLVGLVAPLTVVAVARTQSQTSAQGGDRKSSRAGRALGVALLEAAGSGEADAVAELLARGADVNAVVDGDGSPLIAAARGGHDDVVQLLVDRGADVNLGVSGDGSPLISAARKGYLSIVKLLLDRGADVNLGVPGDGNPLIMAAGDGELEVVGLLLDHGAHIEEIVPGDENPLIHACEGGQLAVVKLLVGRGANVNARVWADAGVQFFPRVSGPSRDGRPGEWRTPLSMARRGRHRDVVEYLLTAGAADGPGR